MNLKKSLKHSKRRRTNLKRKAHLFAFAIVITITVLLALGPSFQSLGSRNASRTSGNACGGPTCHPISVTDTYDEFVTIIDYDIPDKILLGKSAKVYTNISITSTTYIAPDTLYRCDLTVTLTSTNGNVGISGSPKKEFTKYPGFSVQYEFTITGDFIGFDTFKLDARIVTGHAAGVANEFVNADIEVYQIFTNTGPQLLDAMVSPTQGNLDTTFTYSVKYQDPDDDFPVDLHLHINNWSPKNPGVFDGLADTIASGEIYSYTVKGSDLGLGNDHTYRFSATDGYLSAVGDILSKIGPEVKEKIISNKLPEVTIESPSEGTVSGKVTISGTAEDPDASDKIGLVEVRLDNGPWKVADGTESWQIEWDFFNIFPGNHIIYARSSDGKDYSDLDYVVVRTVLSAPDRPSINILEFVDISENSKKISGTSTPADSSLPVDQVEIKIEGQSWEEAKASGPIGGNGYRTFDSWVYTWDTADIDAGFYVIGARAGADGVMSDPVYVTITVERQNRAPVITNAFPGRCTTIHEGSSINLYVNVTEPDNQPISYIWRLDGENLTMPITANSFEFLADYQSAGKYKVEVLVFDTQPENGTAYYWWNLTVLDGLIIEDLTEPKTDFIESEELQEFSVSVFDPEGGRLRYEWFVGSELEPGVFSPSYKFSHEALGPDTTQHSITLVVTNEHEESNSIAWSLDVNGKIEIEEEPEVSEGEAKKEKREIEKEGDIVIVFLVIVLILLSFFMIYSIIRKRKTGVVQATPQLYQPPQGYYPPGVLQGTYPTQDKTGVMQGAPQAAYPQQVGTQQAYYPPVAPQDTQGFYAQSPAVEPAAGWDTTAIQQPAQPQYLPPQPPQATYYNQPAFPPPPPPPAEVAQLSPEQPTGPVAVQQGTQYSPEQIPNDPNQRQFPRQNGGTQ